jgi:glycosyltransferase involved in cell wall biosynthesis
LRDEGWEVETLSIRAGPAPDREPAAAEEARRTFVVMRQGASTFIAAHFRCSLNPLRYARALRLALRHRPPGLAGLLLALAHFAEAGVVARHLKRRGIGHLHNHFANSGATVGLIAAQLAEVGWSFTMHGISETDYPAGLLLGEKIEAADFVVCASWFMRAQGLRTVAPDQWDKLHVVRCGVDRTSLPVREKQRRHLRSAVCVGRLSPEKAHAGLFEAMALLSSDEPQLKLRLVGDGPYRSLLEKRARELGIADRVEFLGARAEASTLSEIADADLLVLPSFLEGLPVVLMEAMSLGVPVIAPRIAGIPELVEHGKSGLLFTASDWSELAQRISQLASDAQLRSDIVRGGRRAVAGEFDVRVAAARLSDLFGSTAKPEGRGGAAATRVASFGLPEANIFSLVALAIAIAVALSSSSSGPEPLPRSAAASKGQVQGKLPGDVEGNASKHGQ